MALDVTGGSAVRRAGRFAPTPTGRLHLGNARTALLAWLWARATGSANVLRVEDLDPAAVPAGAIEGIFADLDWLGLEYDECPRRGGPVGPYLQSQRFPLYEAPLARLAALGLLYPCGCSRKEVALAARAPHGGEPIYPGTCRPAAPSPLDWPPGPLLRAGRPAALRLDVHAALRLLGVPAITFDDAVCGPQRFDAAGLGGDFVVRRADGLCAYQLACAFDDVAMGCDRVLRGVDLLPSAARQALLLAVLGLPVPRYAHVGLVLAADGQKLSKSDGAISLADARARGESSTACLALLAELSGLRPGIGLGGWAEGFEPHPGLAAPVRLPA